MIKSFAVAILALVAVAFIAAFVPAPHLRSPQLASATVYVEMADPNGHGSGVYIGHGLVLTAGHVADDPDRQGAPTVIDNLGHRHPTEMLWASHKYDVALLRIGNGDTIDPKHLSCRYLDLGEPLSFAGNPMNLHDVTTYGRVGNASIQSIGPWAAANIVSGQLIPGMSGGPVFDARGYVVGINVGLATSGGMFGGGAYALSFIVPGRAICNLMGR